MQHKSWSFQQIISISSVQSERPGKLTFAWLLDGRASTVAWATGRRPLWSSTRWAICAPCADGQPLGPSHTHPGKRPLYGSVETCERVNEKRLKKKPTTTRKPTSSVAVTRKKHPRPCKHGVALHEAPLFTLSRRAHKIKYTVRDC